MRPIGRLPYYYFLLLEAREKPRKVRLEDCRIITSFYCAQDAPEPAQIGRLPYYYFLLLDRARGHQYDDWKTAVLLLPSTLETTQTRVYGLEDCRIITSFYFGNHPDPRVGIGRLPYYYFLLLLSIDIQRRVDWKTAVLLLPSTGSVFQKWSNQIGRLPYYYFLLLSRFFISERKDWKTAVLLLPSTKLIDKACEDKIGRLPYYYFLLLRPCWTR